jgi:hypothetical protein
MKYFLLALLLMSASAEACNRTPQETQALVDVAVKALGYKPGAEPVIKHDGENLRLTFNTKIAPNGKLLPANKQPYVIIDHKAKPPRVVRTKQ